MKRLEGYIKPLMWSVAVLLAAIAAGCTNGSDPILGGTAGTTAVNIIPGATCSVAAGPTIPTVTMSDPTSGNQFVTTSTTGVAGSGKLITATFSLAMNATTITATSFTLKPVGGVVLVPASIAYNTSTKVATLTTSSALLANTSYTANITTAVKSAAVPGVSIACGYEWTFKTNAVAGTGAAPVNMGLATPFGISATAGLTTAVSSSTVNADVLLNPLAQCNTTLVDTAGGIGSCLAVGFPPTVNGTVISSQYNPGANMATIAADLNAAFLSTCAPGLPSASCTLTPGTVIGGIGAAAGSALVANVNWFTPGVYSSATTIGLTGDITLDAQGDANAVFMFQAGTALNVADGAAPPMVVSPPSGIHSRVLLVNGAKASNVWWSVGSSATLGLYSEFQGNIIAAVSITLNQGATSCGREMAGAWVGGGGAITLGGANVVAVPGNPFVPPATYSSTCQ